MKHQLTALGKYIATYLVFFPIIYGWTLFWVWFYDWLASFGGPAQ